MADDPKPWRPYHDRIENAKDQRQRERFDPQDYYDYYTSPVEKPDLTASRSPVADATRDRQRTEAHKTALLLKSDVARAKDRQQAQERFEEHLKNNRDLLKDNPAWESEYIRMEGQELREKQAKEFDDWMNRYEEAVRQERDARGNDGKGRKL